MAHLLFVVGASVAVAVSAGCDVSTADAGTSPRGIDTRRTHHQSTGGGDDDGSGESRRSGHSARTQSRDFSRRRAPGREISFIVANGNVSVTGTVRTEEERRKINDLAMNIGGVKSVANALRVEE